VEIFRNSKNLKTDVQILKRISKTNAGLLENWIEKKA
jgi:hypothetical protein